MCFIMRFCLNDLVNKVHKTTKNGDLIKIFIK